MGFLRFILHLAIVAQLAWTASAKRDAAAEKTSEFWKGIAQDELDLAMKVKKNTKVAKNVILFLGDGMGLSSVTAGRILKGQMRGESGEETKLEMEKFPHAALSKTYSVNKQVADSASTATAYLCGVKANYYTFGLTAAAELDNCASEKGNRVDSILVDSYKAGKSTGVVTTTALVHATPGATYAHTANRRWYSDGHLTDEAKQNGCKDIAMQYYDASHMITVTFAGGRAYLRPDNTTDYEYPTKKNKRTDGKDLVEMWKEKMSSAGFEASFVWNKSQFDGVNVKKTDRLLGLFEPNDMHYEAERSRDGAGEPTIVEMTGKAIEMLQKNDKGYFLLVEGGRIDHGHHGTHAYLALHDVVAFDDAIEKAVKMTSDDDTLIIVTADHSHVFTMGGKADRGNNIFGLAPNSDNPKLADDGKPYTTLLYGNGAGYRGHYYVDPVSGYNAANLSAGTEERANLTEVDTTAHGYLQQTAVPLGSETHAGEDVAIFARGPMAHLFHGVHEQNYIAHVMRYASCVGGITAHCDGESPDSATVTYFGNEISLSSAETTLLAQGICLIILGVIILLLIIILIVKLKR